MTIGSDRVATPHPLRGRAAIVTGGGAGIGRAIALRMAAAGCAVGLIDVQEEALARVAGEIGAADRQVCQAVADVADEEQSRQAVDRLRRDLGRLDILVNCAGILRLGRLEEISMADWRDTFRVNVDGLFHVSRAAIPHLRAQGSGRIVNISSWLGKSGKAYYGAYCASKAAIISLTETMALELAGDRITVNAVCPGIIMRTGMRDRAEVELQQLGLPSAEARMAGIPLGRLGQPEDVAEIATFLASDAAAYMTGHTVNVTGGLWLQ
ncbi:SDR family NAD(P)-dependent oxidoreductase [Geminicoccus roseus]|uniref:SDR family NAD(P)-dependent oxidoreductase n=1 Tax=Geminicoccus roseus TaxID=404900 RepID=UPI00040CAB32|nr:SDR family NAD(P)-dependent oxidoreductase [Geminicoccus roseus]